MQRLRSVGVAVWEGEVDCDAKINIAASKYVFKEVYWLFHIKTHNFERVCLSFEVSGSFFDLF